MIIDSHAGVASVLAVRRSTLVPATPARVWREFESFARMQQWWGVLRGVPEAGKGNGQRLMTYEPRVGGRVEMEVLFDGVPARWTGRWSSCGITASSSPAATSARSMPGTRPAGA